MSDEIRLSKGSIMVSADSVEVDSTRHGGTWSFIEGPVSADGFFRMTEVVLPNWRRSPQLIIRKEPDV